MIRFKMQYSELLALTLRCLVTHINLGCVYMINANCFQFFPSVTTENEMPLNLVVYSVCSAVIGRVWRHTKEIWGAGGHILWLGEFRRSSPCFVNLSCALFLPIHLNGLKKT